MELKPFEEYLLNPQRLLYRLLDALEPERLLLPPEDFLRLVLPDWWVKTPASAELNAEDFFYIDTQHEYLVYFDNASSQYFTHTFEDYSTELRRIYDFVQARAKET